MDPLSIGSAVVGLIAAASRIAPVLQHFITHTRDAPKSASQVLREMQSITSALEQLQVYLIGVSKTKAGRRAMLSLRSIVTSLTACVTTYSDLERVVSKCVSDGQVKRVKWMFYESEIGELVQKVQEDKLSLVFMLSILQSESQREAENSMERLEQSVERIISSNEDIMNRMNAIAMEHGSLAIGSRTSLSDASLSSLSQPRPGFEEDLNSSRVYKKLRPRDSIWSISSSQRESMAMSNFSDLTLGNISIISVFSLPVWSADLSNPSHYRFGRDGLTLTVDELVKRFLDIEFPDPAFSDNECTLNEDENEDARDVPKVLFLAASLFEFNVPPRQPHGKILRLTYVPGEIFDVFGIKDELWLARKQDDAEGTLGWIWEKHFARVIEYDSE